MIESTDSIVSGYCRTGKCKFEKSYIKRESNDLINIINEIISTFSGHNVLLFNFLDEKDSLLLFPEFLNRNTFRIVSFSNVELMQIKTNPAIFEGHYFVSHDSSTIASNLRTQYSFYIDFIIMGLPNLKKTESLFAQ